MLTVTVSFDERDITFQDVPGTFQEFEENVQHVIKHHNGIICLSQSTAKHLVNLYQVTSIEIIEQNDDM